VQIRRVVTGVDGNGRSHVTSDDTSRTEVTFPESPGFEITRLWSITDTPPALIGGDPTSGTWSLDPPLAGLNWQIISRPPDRHMRESRPRSGIAGQGPKVDVAPRIPAPGLHQTDTLDLVMVLSGAIFLTVGGAELQLAAGDCLVQRGAEHAWENRGDEPCVMLAVMVDAHP
jgi:hypothetical protein